MDFEAMTSDLEQIVEEMEGHVGKTQARAGTIIENYKWPDRIRAWIAANKEFPQRKAFVEAAEKWGEWYCDNFKDYFKSGDWSAEEKEIMLTYRAMIDAEKVEAERGEKP